MLISNKILDFVLSELKNRDVLDENAMENCFGCKSYDEVREGIDEILTEHNKKFADEYIKALIK